MLCWQTRQGHCVWRRGGEERGTHFGAGAKNCSGRMFWRAERDCQERNLSGGVWEEQRRGRWSRLLLAGPLALNSACPSLPKLEKPRETQLLAPYLKIVRGAHSVSMGPSAKGKLSCATCLGRDRKSVLLSPPADSLQKWGDVRRGYRSAPRWALLPLPQVRQQRGHSSTQGVRRGRERADRFLTPAWAVLTHSHAWVSEGHLQSDLHWAGVAFVLFGDLIRSDK